MKLKESKYFVLFILALVWGTSFILIKKAVEVYSPYQVGALRMIMAGLLLVVIGVPTLRKLDRNTIKWMLISGFFGSFLPMYLFPMAEVRVSSSLAGILNSLVPIFTLLFGYFIFNIKNTKLQIVGAVLGLLGANILMYYAGGSEDGQSSFGYAMLIVIATACYAISGLIVKEKLQHVKSLALSGAMFTMWSIPAIFILIFSGFFTAFEATTEQIKGLGYIAILGIVGTALAMILFYKLIQDTSAVFASSVTYLMPIVAIGWGLLAGEAFNLWFVLGGFLILAGVYLIREKKI